MYDRKPIVFRICWRKLNNTWKIEHNMLEEPIHFKVIFIPYVNTSKENDDHITAPTWLQTVYRRKSHSFRRIEEKERQTKRKQKESRSQQMNARLLNSLPLYAYYWGEITTYMKNAHNFDNELAKEIWTCAYSRLVIIMLFTEILYFFWYVSFNWLFHWIVIDYYIH